MRFSKSHRLPLVLALAASMCAGLVTHALRVSDQGDSGAEEIAAHGRWQREATILSDFRECKERLARNSNDAAAHRGLGSYYLSKSLGKDHAPGDRAQALYHDREVVRLDPGNLYAQNTLAAVLVSIGQRDEATQLLNRIVATDTSRAGAYSEHMDVNVEKARWRLEQLRRKPG